MTRKTPAHAQVVSVLPEGLPWECFHAFCVASGSFALLPVCFVRSARCHALDCALLQMSVTLALGASVVHALKLQLLLIVFLRSEVTISSPLAGPALSS